MHIPTDAIGSVANKKEQANQETIIAKITCANVEDHIFKKKNEQTLILLINWKTQVYGVILRMSKQLQRYLQRYYIKESQATKLMYSIVC